MNKEIIDIENEKTIAYLKQPRENLPKVRPEIIDGLVNLSPGQIGYPLNLKPENPDYPNHPTFETFYSHAGPFNAKVHLAEALLEDGRYKNISLLVREFIPRGTQITPEIEELRDLLRIKVKEALLKRGDTRQSRIVSDEVKLAASEIIKGETVDAKRFRQLIGMFGSSHAADILLKTRPDFKGLPVDRVRSILGEYLGDFLVAKSNFSLESLEVGREYLSDLSFQEGLFEVIKDSALDYSNQQKKNLIDIPDNEIFVNYVENLKNEARNLKDDGLDKVVELVEDYYKDVFNGFSKPQSIIDEIRPGRTFPDTPQLINISEVKSKKRILIADEMGLGKSATPILVYESLREEKKLLWEEIGPCVITAPSDVISTWEKYLSSDIDEQGKQKGYFRINHEPNVLTVENINQLKETELNGFDYILISHEKLDKKYIEELEKIDIGMLAVDEVHKLKNLTDGVRSANLLRLAEKIESEDKILTLLSGTPIPNKVKDIGIILKLLYPDKFANMDNHDLVAKIIKGDQLDLRSLLIPRMQMKSLSENLQMPNLFSDIVRIPMSFEEKLAYEVLREEDEITPTEKLRLMRMFALNPDLLNITPSIKGSKIEAISNHINYRLESKDKIVIFVNDYIEGVIRGEINIIKKMNIHGNVEINIISGDTTLADRDIIQSKLNTQDGKKLVVFVSGQTAGVGRDFSGASDASFYNEPWTIPDKNQQLHRAYREGRNDELNSTTFILQNSIEDGIHEYIEMKYKAILKLLKGVPISEVEKELLERAESEPIEGLEVNRELAEYYFSSWDKMQKIFSYVKEIGEREFVDFLKSYGTDYADSYIDLGRRSYQANASRVSASLIYDFIQNHTKKLEDIKILDLASGPEMLKRHMQDNLQNNIYSLDINNHHFGSESENSSVATFTKIPFQKNSFDYVNMSLGLHYTKFIPSQNNFERLEALAELHSVLKPGGRAVINFIYSLDLKNQEKFEEIAGNIGFTIMKEFSGEINENNSYISTIYTLEKQDDFEWNLDELIKLTGKENFDGLKFKRTKKNLRNIRKVLRNFTIDGKKIQINLNTDDSKVLAEEEKYTNLGENLKKKYKSIKDIPESIVVKHGFVRIFVGHKYNLFKKLEKGEGVIIVK